MLKGSQEVARLPLHSSAFSQYVMRLNVFLTDKQHYAVPAFGEQMAHRFLEYQPYKGEIDKKDNGAIIAMESGTAFAYAIDKLQDRGRFFIHPQD